MTVGLTGSPRPFAKIWILAGLVAFALHAGAVALIVMHTPDEDDNDAGAPAIEIGLDMTAPHDDATDLPPGPVSDASTAAPAVVEQKANLEKTELPKETPVEKDEADRVVSPEATKNPQEKDPKIERVEAAPSTESVAMEATAPPPSEAVREAPRSVAPMQGIDDAAAQQRATWQKQLVSHLDRHKRHPANGAPKNVEILVNFTLDRLGHVLAAHIAKGSGDAAYDEAALAMIRKSDPVPAPPPLVADEGLSFTLPVIFRVKQGR